MLGATLILPFAGLEIFFVSLGFYANFKWSRQKEVIYLSHSKIKIEKGRILEILFGRSLEHLLSFRLKKPTTKRINYFFHLKASILRWVIFLIKNKKRI